MYKSDVWETTSGPEIHFYVKKNKNHTKLIVCIIFYRDIAPSPIVNES